MCLLALMIFVLLPLPTCPHPQIRETWLNADMLRTLQVTFQKVLKGEEEAPTWGELFPVCFLICKMGISSNTHIFSYYLLDLNGRCLELALTCSRYPINAFFFKFCAPLFCVLNISLCITAAVCVLTRQRGPQLSWLYFRHGGGSCYLQGSGPSPLCVYWRLRKLGSGGTEGTGNGERRLRESLAVWMPILSNLRRYMFILYQLKLLAFIEG